MTSTTPSDPSSRLARRLDDASRNLDELARAGAEERATAALRCLLAELRTSAALLAPATTRARLASDMVESLNSVFLHVQMLRRHLASVRPEDGTSRRLDEITTEVHRLTEYADEIRPSEAAVELSSIVDFELGALLNDVLARQSLDANGARIDVPAPLAGAPTVNGDRDKLERALRIIVTLSIASMPPGAALRVAIGAEAGAVQLAFEHPVRDGGAIDGDERRLALSTAREIIEAHGGVLARAAALAGVSGFAVTLPLAAP